MGPIEHLSYVYSAKLLATLATCTSCAFKYCVWLGSLYSCCCQWFIYCVSSLILAGMICVSARNYSAFILWPCSGFYGLFSTMGTVYTQSLYTCAFSGGFGLVLLTGFAGVGCLSAVSFYTGAVHCSPQYTAFSCLAIWYTGFFYCHSWYWVTSDCI